MYVEEKGLQQLYTLERQRAKGNTTYTTEVLKLFHKKIATKWTWEVYSHAEDKNLILCLELYINFASFKLLIMQSSHAENSTKLMILLKSFQDWDPNQHFPAFSLLQHVCS